MTSGQSEASEQIMTTPTTRRTLVGEPVGWYQAMLPNGDERFVWWNQAIACDQFGNPHKGRDVEIISGPLLTASEWEDKMKGIATTTTLECDKTYLCGAGLVATIRPDELKRLREIEQVAVSLIESWKRCGIKYGDGLDAADALWRLIDPAPAFTPPPKPELRLFHFANGKIGWQLQGFEKNLGNTYELDPTTGKPLEKQA